jgi:hypothetical protein
MLPFPIAHGTATASDYDWTLSPTLLFVAQSTSTNLRFVSNDVTFTDAGIFLDAISVDRVPEPATFIVGAILGLIFFGAHRRARP